jgi:hypothetical protein
VGLPATVSPGLCARGGQPAGVDDEDDELEVDDELEDELEVDDDEDDEVEDDDVVELGGGGGATAATGTVALTAGSNPVTGPSEAATSFALAATLPSALRPSAAVMVTPSGSWAANTRRSTPATASSTVGTDTTRPSDMVTAIVATSVAVRPHATWRRSVEATVHRPDRAAVVSSSRHVRPGSRSSSTTPWAPPPAHSDQGPLGSWSVATWWRTGPGRVVDVVDVVVDVEVVEVDVLGGLDVEDVGGRVVDGRLVVERGRVVEVPVAGGRPPTAESRPRDPRSEGVGPGLAGGSVGVPTVAGRDRVGVTVGSGPRWPRS